MNEMLIKNLNWDKKHTLYLTITPDMEVSAESGFLDEKIEGVQVIELRPHGDLIERDRAIEEMDYASFDTLHNCELAQEVLRYDVTVFLEATEKNK